MEDEAYGLDLSREDLDILRRLSDNGGHGVDVQTLRRLERLGYLSGEMTDGSRVLTAKGELTCTLVR